MKSRAMKPKPKIYIETSVVSYLVARPSRDLIIAAHQQITYDWWHEELPKFDAWVSDPVIDEAGKGDSEAAQYRLQAIKEFPVLEENNEILELAQIYLTTISLPEKCRVDCVHMAAASA